MSFLPSLYSGLKIEFFTYQLPTLERTAIIRKEVSLLSLTVQFPVFQLMEEVGETCRPSGMSGRSKICQAVEQSTQSFTRLNFLDVSGRDKTWAASCDSWSWADLTRKIRSSESCHMSVALICPQDVLNYMLSVAQYRRPHGVQKSLGYSLLASGWHS